MFLPIIYNMLPLQIVSHAIERWELGLLGPEQESAYEAMDEEIMKEAPWAPYGTRTLDTFVADNVELESIIYSPTFFEYLTSFEFKE